MVDDLMIGVADPKPERVERSADVVEHLTTFPYWGHSDFELHLDAAAEIERLRILGDMLANVAAAYNERHPSEDVSSLLATWGDIRRG